MNVLGIMIMSLQTKNDLTDTRGLRLNRKQVAPTIKLEPLVLPDKFKLKIKFV